MKHFVAILLIVGFLFSSCKKSDPSGPVITPLYFPPVSGTTWNTIDTDSLDWNAVQLDSLYTYLQSKNTDAFIILKDGRIAVEYYFGSFTRDSLHYWASAGKTVTGLLCGIARQEGLLDFDRPTSYYIGSGWSSLPANKENLITVRNQLTMTTGLDDEIQPDNHCTLPSCLVYKADAGTRWAYHNAPYTLLDTVLQSATGLNINSYFQQKIRNVIGMNGLWFKIDYDNVYFSNARSMARFGLLMLNKGKWDQTTILSDTAYFNTQINSSQSLNPSYGYLTWLNGKASHMLPTSQIVFQGMLVPNAPADMYCALGKNDQKLYVVPSQNLVVIRLGESAGNVQLALSSFDNELWGKLKTIIGY